MSLLKYSSATSYSSYRSGPLHLVAAVGSTADQFVAGPTGIHCPPVGSRAHSQGAAGLGRERECRESCESDDPLSAAGPHVVGQTEQWSSGREPSRRAVLYRRKSKQQGC